MSGSPVNEKVFQPAGHGSLYCSSQYWMNTNPLVPSLANTNCSQPRQPGLGEAAHAGLEKKLVLICSVYASATGGPTLPMGDSTLVTLMRFSNEPLVSEMV